jgi:hypothetical protein
VHTETNCWCNNNRLAIVEASTGIVYLNARRVWSLLHARCPALQGNMQQHVMVMCMEDWVAWCSHYRIPHMADDLQFDVYQVSINAHHLLHCGPFYLVQQHSSI